MMLIFFFHSCPDYMMNACEGRRMDGESNESVYNQYDLSNKGERMEYIVIERAKCSVLKWFGLIEVPESLFIYLFFFFSISLTVCASRLY